jgi:hypothetical protein
MPIDILAEREPIDVLAGQGPVDILADKDSRGIFYPGFHVAPAEAVLSFGSGIASLIPSGLAGVGYAFSPRDAAEGVETVRDYWQYDPRYPEGEKLAEIISWPFPRSTSLYRNTRS